MLSNADLEHLDRCVDLLRLHLKKATSLLVRFSSQIVVRYSPRITTMLLVAIIPNIQNLP
jgi:hypothetical protein